MRRGFRWVILMPAQHKHPNVLAFDGSWNGDSTALVGCTVQQIPYLWVAGCWERPEHADAGWHVPVVEVEERIVAVCGELEVVEVCADPARWQRSIDVLEHRLSRVDVLQFPQTSARMVPATARLREAFVNRQVTHDGDRRLREHIANAVVKDTGRGERIFKEGRKSPRKIDLAIAAVMAFDRASWRFQNDDDVPALLVAWRGGRDDSGFGSVGHHGPYQWPR